MFMEHIQSHNDWVLSEYNKNNKPDDEILDTDFVSVTDVEDA